MPFAELQCAIARRLPNRWATVLVLAAVIAVTVAAPLRADYSPKSKEVKDLVNRGIGFVASQEDQRVGAYALFGLTLLKADRKPSDPLVQKALGKVTTAHQSKSSLALLDVYSLGLCIIFLVELDAEAHRGAIQTYFDHLISIQKPHGGWGYPDKQTGDTSMTQYAVLAMWEMEHAGIKTPLEIWEKVANWLMRTQDPTGAWGYQGKDPSNFQLVAQSEIRESMASAGLGSLYICADHFQYRRRGPVAEPVESNAILQKVRKPKPPPEPEKPKVPLKTVDLNRLGQTLERGDQWMEKNYTIKPNNYAHYFLYAFERYQSFRETSTSPPFTPSHWYDDGVRRLGETQGSDGSWTSQTGSSTDTCFALLFLLRSSQKSITKVQHLGPGTLVSGRGLPEGNEVELRMGQVRQKPLAGPAEQLLAAIEDPGHPDYLRAVEGLEEKAERAPATELGKLSQRLRKLAGGDSPQARSAALRVLGRTRDLDNVPMLLAALADPDDDVFLAAEESLQFMSRTIPDQGENEGITPNRRADAQRKWRVWYLTIRPNAKLDN